MSLCKHKKILLTKSLPEMNYLLIDYYFTTTTISFALKL